MTRTPLSRAAGLLREGLWPLELARLVLAVPELARLPRGNGEPVLVLPGFGTGDGSTALLRAFLRRLGYRVSGWGLGVNTGAVARLLPRVVERAEARAARLGAPLRLVGWSLGGYLAREVARDRPGIVHQVVTLGSPIIGGPKYTAAAPLYRGSGADLDAIELAVAARASVPIRVPITVIYSRADGIVHWRACIDRESPDVEHVEVGATHLGLGFSAEVFGIVAERLARPRAWDSSSASSSRAASWIATSSIT